MELSPLVGFGSAVAGTLLVLAGCLHLLSRLGSAGNRMGEWCRRAPGLDLLITVFTVLPWLAGGVLFGWIGIPVGVAGQVVAICVWVWAHERAHASAVKGPRILKVLNSRVGRFRNHTAVWVTTLAVPMFWLVRLAEWVVYPPLVLLVRFPRYRSGDWVNVSRQKFEGLVGWDLIWCLYCDWMTGVWSLGTEMLRNVESFWCPIRFHSDKKCENCSIDFPDIEGGWVRSDGSMAEVARVLEEKYPANPDQPYSWYGHPDRKECGPGGCKGCKSEAPDEG